MRQFLKWPAVSGEILCVFLISIAICEGWRIWSRSSWDLESEWFRERTNTWAWGMGCIFNIWYNNFNEYITILKNTDPGRGISFFVQNLIFDFRSTYHPPVKLFITKTFKKRSSCTSSSRHFWLFEKISKTKKVRKIFMWSESVFFQNAYIFMIYCSLNQLNQVEACW